MKIAIGCDEAAYALKVAIMKHLDTKEDIEYKDFGAAEGEVILYPDVAQKVAEAVARGEFDRGILVCGTGLGMCIVANKVPGIRCGLCADTYSAKMTREHNDANMLAMGAGIVGPNLALSIVETFLNTPFSGDEKHVRRINKIEEEVK